MRQPQTDEQRERHDLILRAHAAGIDAFGWSMREPVVENRGKLGRTTITWEQLRERVERAERRKGAR